MGRGANRRWRRYSILLLLTLLVAAVVSIKPAAAHPLGNFTINRYSRVQIGANGVTVYYVLDVAEIPTFQEKTKIDQNNDGQISDAEKQSYLDQKTTELIGNVTLTINDVPMALNTVSQDLAFLPGQGGLQTMRLTAYFHTAALDTHASRLGYTDMNYADRVGWREVIVQNATGVALVQSSVSSKDQSNELRVYPQDMLASPLSINTAQVTFTLDPRVVVKETAPVAQTNSILNRAQDPFADFVNSGELTPTLILFSFLAAIALGAFHALSPGHGKTVVAAYLVGSRGTARHAIFLGLTVTVTHTLGVYTLGLLTLFASQFIVPDRLYPWLGVLSGLMVIVMGLNLFRSRLLSVFGKRSDHGHDHGHDHANPDHSYDFATAMPVDEPRDLAARAQSVTHTHDGGTEHTHLPPGADGAPLTWKRLLVFGISAGLLPCPSALVVMLSAIALNRVAFGLILIIFFSCGLAAALTGMGLFFVYARSLLLRAKIRTSGRVLTLLPVASAFIVTVIGVAISYEAALQTGVFTR